MYKVSQEAPVLDRVADYLDTVESGHGIKMSVPPAMLLGVGSFFGVNELVNRAFSVNHENNLINDQAEELMENAATYESTAEVLNGVGQTALADQLEVLAGETTTEAETIISTLPDSYSSRVDEDVSVIAGLGTCLLIGTVFVKRVARRAQKARKNYPANPVC